MQQVSKRLMNWASIIEPATLEQAERTASMPFIQPHLALMPDAHLGKGATVGSVIPTVGAIMPAAVGVDIGCGMIAVQTQHHRDELMGDLADLRRAIEAAVPLSAGRYNTALTATAEVRIEALEKLAAAAGFDPASYVRNWQLQLGSLGSGNHFIEVTVDEAGEAECKAPLGDVEPVEPSTTARMLGHLAACDPPCVCRDCGGGKPQRRPGRASAAARRMMRARERRQWRRQAVPWIL